MKRTIIAMALLAATGAHAETLVWETPIARTILASTFKMSGTDRQSTIREYNSGQIMNADVTVTGCDNGMGEIRTRFHYEIDDHLAATHTSFWVKRGTTKEDVIAKAVCSMKRRG
jgi:hypothetical protein